MANVMAKLKMAEEKREKNIENIKKTAAEIGQRRPSLHDFAPLPEGYQQ
jgi:hypothetical protein